MRPDLVAKLEATVREAMAAGIRYGDWFGPDNRGPILHGIFLFEQAPSKEVEQAIAAGGSSCYFVDYPKWRGYRIAPGGDFPDYRRRYSAEAGAIILQDAGFNATMFEKYHLP